MKIALVTGGSGFIGGHLVSRLLLEGVRVRVLVHVKAPHLERPGIEAIHGDIRDDGGICEAAKGCDAVFHLAARTHAPSELDGEGEEYESLNVRGTRNALIAAAAAGAERFVFFSSVKAIGEGSRDCVDESADARPTSAYGRTKLEAERLVLEQGSRRTMHTVCLRLPMVYGPGNRGNIHRMVDAVARGLFPPLPDVGNRRSIVHVANVVKAACLAAVSPAASGQIYIVTDGRPYSSRELYELICKGLGRAIPGWNVPLPVLRGLARAGDVIGRAKGRQFFFNSDALEKVIGSAWYSSEKISGELGYHPSVTFEEALPELLAWYRAARA